MGASIPDFGGYATKNDLKCTDGRTIRRDAFKHNDGQTVPLVWQHLYDSPENILGHAKLENRGDGVYAYGYLNGSEAGLAAKELIRHGDISSLSIYANRLVQKGGDVLGGTIKEVSLVMSGANPGAMIDQTNLSHSEEDPEANEAIIYADGDLQVGDTLTHSEETKKEEAKVAEEFDGQKVFDTLNEDQKKLVRLLVADALESADDEDVEHEDDNEGEQLTHYNVFEDENSGEQSTSLSHSELRAIVDEGIRHGSLRDSFLTHAQEYGITNIDLLFPEAKALSETPEFIKRQTEWVTTVLSGTRKSPFSRVKTLFANITHDEARARGYITGAMKKEEYFDLVGRETHPTTIYKKQKIDRDDVVDVTSIDVISWLKAEMRLMLNEEVARAILYGDGRDPGSPDRIDTTKIRPIATDHEFFVVNGGTLSGTTNEDFQKKINTIARKVRELKGTGGKTLYAPADFVSDLLFVTDKDGKRMYNTLDELARALGVVKIVEPDVPTNVAIIVNLADYVVGADKGGEINFFDDFDIDFNQNKYLIESRMSGALVQPKSALKFTLSKSYAGTGVVTNPDFGEDAAKPKGRRKTVHDEVTEPEPETGA